MLVAVPSLSTTVSAPTVPAGDQVNDSIVVHGTGGQPGSLHWELLGPVATGSDGSCTGASFKDAPTVAEGTLAVTGDKTYTTRSVTLADGGCFGYKVTLSGDSYGADVVSDAGAKNEVVQSKPQTAAQRIVNLSVTKQVNTQVATFGQPLTYKLIADNSGPDAATDVTVTDTPQTPMRLVSVSSPQGNCGNAFPVVCTLGQLQAGSTWTVTVVAVPETVGDVGNGVHVTTPDTNKAKPKRVVSHAHTNVKATLKLAKRAQVRSVDGQTPGRVRDHRHQPDEGGRQAGSGVRPAAARARVRVGFGQDQDQPGQRLLDDRGDRAACAQAGDDRRARARRLERQAGQPRHPGRSFGRAPRGPRGDQGDPGAAEVDAGDRLIARVRNQLRLIARVRDQPVIWTGAPCGTWVASHVTGPLSIRMQPCEAADPSGFSRLEPPRP